MRIIAPRDHPMVLLPALPTACLAALSH